MRLKSNVAVKQRAAIAGYVVSALAIVSVCAEVVKVKGKNIVVRGAAFMPVFFALAIALVLGGGVAHAVDDPVTVPALPNFAPTLTAVQTYSQNWIAAYFAPLILIAITWGGMNLMWRKIRGVFGH
jgi:Na+/proline symporter